MRTSYSLFDIECGIGWEKLYAPLIQLCIENNVEITQIKEKFGGLRFYTRAAPTFIQDAIAAAESESLKTCEECGGSGKLRSGGWLRTLCDLCYTKRKKK